MVIGPQISRLAGHVRVPGLATARFDAAVGRSQGNAIAVATAAKMKMPTTTVKAVTSPCTEAWSS
jgi:hypothetical protein